MSQARRTVRLRIEGRVQGVGFRIFVEREAVALGLDGWVRNRRDGGVEVLVAGPVSGIDALVARCHEGPTAAHVAMVKVIDEPDAQDLGPGFDVRPTV
jgi:acylphosphatase